MRKISITAVLAVALLTAAGCATGRALNPFGSVSASDAEWVGISGQTIPIIGSVDPRLAEAQKILESLGVVERLGDYLPLTVAGESSPRLVVCVGEWVDKCEAIKSGLEVHFAGFNAGGSKWYPKRLGV